MAPVLLPCACTIASLRVAICLAYVLICSVDWAMLPFTLVRSEDSVPASDWNMLVSVCAEEITVARVAELFGAVTIVCRFVKNVDIVADRPVVELPSALLICEICW